MTNAVSRSFLLHTYSRARSQWLVVMLLAAALVAVGGMVSGLGSAAREQRWSDAWQRAVESDVGAGHVLEAIGMEQARVIPARIEPVGAAAGASHRELATLITPEGQVIAVRLCLAGAPESARNESGPDCLDAKTLRRLTPVEAAPTATGRAL